MAYSPRNKAIITPGKTVHSVKDTEAEKKSSLSFQSSYGSGHRRHGGLMVSALVSKSSGPGSRPGRGHCVILLSQCFSPPRCINGYQQN